MCSGGFSKCLGISLMPLLITCVLCNILLFFPGGTVVSADHITNAVWCFGGIVGSGLLIIPPAVAFLENNDCCGCCGNESCGRRCAFLSSILFAAIGIVGAAYSVIVSCVAINEGPQCLSHVNGTNQWIYPFKDGDYLSNRTLWSQCLEPSGVVNWHLALFAVLLVIGLVQVALCVIQVVNGLVGAIFVGCCGCCGEKEEGAV